MSTLHWAAVWLLLAGCAGVAANAPAPSSESLLAVRSSDGAPLDLVALASQYHATVLFWYGTSCPCVERYHARWDLLRLEYDERDVAFFVVSSNADDAEEEVRTSMEERGFTGELLLDPGGALARALDVRTTPTVAILGPTGEPAFVGFIDNWTDIGADGREAWLQEALERVLAGETEFTTSPVFGCPVTR